MLNETLQKLNMIWKYCGLYIDMPDLPLPISVFYFSIKDNLNTLCNFQRFRVSQLLAILLYNFPYSVTLHLPLVVAFLSGTFDISG